MEIIDDKREEAKENRRIRDERTDMKLQEVSNQVKLAKDRELGYLMCKAAQLRVRLNGKEG